jgi:hypothetical protein
MHGVPSRKPLSSRDFAGKHQTVPQTKFFFDDFLTGRNIRHHPGQSGHDTAIENTILTVSQGDPGYHGPWGPGETG